MASWDQDIHRIQEIQQLLESRQRYFGGQLNNSCYKVDKVGNSLFFPSLESGGVRNLVEPSLGRSMEAHYGSSDSKEDPAPTEVSDDEGEEGHDADASSDLSDLSGSSNEFVEKRQVRNKEKTRRRSNAKQMRKWINQNLDKVSTTENLVRVGKEELELRRQSTALPQKYVSFDDKLPSKNNFTSYSVSRGKHSKKKSDPILLLQNRSWKLRAEIASRMGDEDMDVSVLNSVTKSSIAYAREKLKNSEKSLQAAVISEHQTPVRKPLSRYTSKGENKKQPTAQSSYAVKKAVSRLSERQAEESLRSDLNLREAFALIKINPDPIISLKSPIKDKGGKEDAYEINQGDFSRFEDPETESLKRLTRLSLEHKQKQRSLVKDNPSRRKSSVSSTSLPNVIQRRQSNDFRSGHRGSNASYLHGEKIRDDKTNKKNMTPTHRKDNGPSFHTLDKLTGTLI
ncbi:unnamed protein product [Orchesella dallaii]|uniref:Uncharacterized protein n=1 Tax=Orchesella dallaii TaxID=48710 RepID=A0ABP1QPY7_9HEXA